MAPNSKNASHEGPRKEGLVAEFERPSEPPKIIESLGFPELRERLREVPLLNDSVKGLQPYRNSHIELAKVKIGELLPCALYVLNQNLAVQEALREEFLVQGIDTLNLTYDRALINYSWGGVNSVLIPPIIEISEDDGFAPIITDGLHRIFTAIALGIEEIIVVLVRNTAVPLSPLPVRWDEVVRVNSVPPADQKRRFRFREPGDLAKNWLGVDNKVLKRFVSGFPKDFAGTILHPYGPFRDLGYVGKVNLGVPQENRQRIEELLASKEKCLKEYTSAGFMITSEDSQYILMGSHHEAPELFGNFAGSREIWENDPRDTARRELKEELGLVLDSDMDLGEPFIVIDNHWGLARPTVGIIYRLKVDKNRKINIPSDSEIKDLSWESGMFPLINSHDGIHALWGGPVTAAILERFQQIKDGAIHPSNFKYAPWDYPGGGEVEFGGIVEISNRWGYGEDTRYEKLKLRDLIEARDRKYGKRKEEVLAN